MLIEPVYLEQITDEFGVWQHSRLDEIHKEEGYALDDSARALIVFLLYGKKQKAEVCLTYLEKSLKENSLIGFFWDNKTIRTFPSSKDAFALTIWALCFCINYGFEVNRANKLLETLLSNKEFMDPKYIRTYCYLLISLLLIDKKDLCDKYFNNILSYYSPKLNWFESGLYYANAIIPTALIKYFQKYPTSFTKGNKEILLNSIKTIEKYSYIDTIPSPVSNIGWQILGKKRTEIYGQQPIDSAFMVMLYSELTNLLKEDKYISKKKEWREWFYGNNIINQSLVDTKTFKCADGIDSSGISKNYGAESTIVYLWQEKY